MSQDIKQTLQDLSAARQKLHADLAETVTVLDAVGQKIQDFERRQRARMFEDIRLDNELLRQQQTAPRKAGL